VGACSDRIGRGDRREGLVHLDRALALKQARGRRRQGGLLRGVPIGVKDIIDTHDMRRPQLPILRDAAVRDGAAWRLPERKRRHHGQTSPRSSPTHSGRHIRTSAHTPALSSGSGRRVADGHALAFGTQTAVGDRPAAYCGSLATADLGDFCASASNAMPFGR